MIALEFFAIFIAFFMEAVHMQTGSIKALTDLLSKCKEKNVYIAMALSFLFLIGSLSYIIFAISWCFSESFPVQVSGLVLMGLSIIVLSLKAAKKPRPVWFIQVDSMLSMLCIIIVAVARVRGI
jgi:phosphoglycerol transferase MdoB-like AlkP superfamily enzyme